jgi:hypothetical protein
MMERGKIIADFQTALSDFMGAVTEDPRMGPTHVSLFLAILYFYKKQKFQSPISIYSKELMKQAKISSCGTYHRCIQELHKYGFIQYVPSFNPVLGSLIYVLKFYQNENIYRTEARAK